MLLQWYIICIKDVDLRSLETLQLPPLCMLSVNCHINSWFVKLFEINRYILKIFPQNNARFHALIQVDLRSFVRKKETTR